MKTFLLIFAGLETLALIGAVWYHIKRER